MRCWVNTRLTRSALKLLNRPSTAARIAIGNDWFIQNKGAEGSVTNKSGREPLSKLRHVSNQSEIQLTFFEDKESFSA